MNLLIVSKFNFYDKYSWSGGLNPIYLELKSKYITFETFSPNPQNIFKRFLWKLNSLSYFIFGKYFEEQSIFLSRLILNWELSKKIKKNKYDVILVISSFVELLSIPDTDAKIIFYSDVTQELFSSLYPSKKNKFYNWSNQLQISLERKAFERTYCLVFSST